MRLPRYTYGGGSTLTEKISLSDLQKLEALLVPVKRNPRAHKDYECQYSEALLLKYGHEGILGMATLR